MRRFLIIRLSVLVAYALINISNNEQNIKVEKFMNQQPTQNIANIQSIQQVLDLKPKILTTNDHTNGKSIMFLNYSMTYYCTLNRKQYIA